MRSELCLAQRSLLQQLAEGLRPQHGELGEAAVRRGDGQPLEAADLALHIGLDPIHGGRLDHRDVVHVAPQVGDLDVDDPHDPLDGVVRQVALLVGDTGKAELRHPVDGPLLHHSQVILLLQFQHVLLVVGECRHLDVDVVRRHQCELDERGSDRADQRTDEQPLHDQRDRQPWFLERVVLAGGVDHDDLDGVIPPAILLVQLQNHVGRKATTERCTHQDDRTELVLELASDRRSRLLDDDLGEETVEAVADEQPGGHMLQHGILDLGDTLVTVEQNARQVDEKSVGLRRLAIHTAGAERGCQKAQEPTTDGGIQRDQRCNASDYPKESFHFFHFQSVTRG